MKLKINVQAFKNISVAYMLQVFAVIVLFFFAGTSAANKVVEPVKNKSVIPVSIKNNILNTYKDPSLSGKADFFWKPNFKKPGSKK